MFFSQAGCLLLLLIFFNFFFGLFFFRFTHWLLIEAGLVFLLILNSFFAAKKLTGKLKQRDGVIDVEGEVVEDGFEKLE